MSDVIIRGGEQLERLSAEIKRTGNGGLRRDLLRGIQRAAKPLKGVAQNAARTRLPHEGGLNEVIAASKFAVRTRTSGRTPGVRVLAMSGHDIGAINRGTVRHPVWASGPRSEWTWSTQQVEPGWFTAALAAQAPAVRSQIIRAMTSTAQRLAHYG